MNLYYLAEKRNSVLDLSEGVAVHRKVIDTETWRGLLLNPGATIILRDILRFFPFRERPSHCDWFLVTERRDKTPQHVTVSLTDASQTISEKAYPVNVSARLMLLPWPLANAPFSSNLDLVIKASNSNSSPIFLAVHRAISREGLLSAAKGVGVEIGPGANPQLRPDEQRRVFYLEQMPPDEWARLYATKAVDPSLWQQYKIGEAHELPFDDHSLDFIFSCHVFEHLSNPLGHLEHWRTKLRSRGVVLGVVPDIAGAKDAVHTPCGLQELLKEYQDGNWEPSEEQYRRYASKFGKSIDPLEWKRQRRSIHVHFYTNRNMSELLSFACSTLGYAGFHIQHTPNHKDFHFMLIAS